MAMSVSRRPFRARRGPGRHLGFRRSGSTLGYDPTPLRGLCGCCYSYSGFRRSGSTLGYDPAAASRLPSPDEQGSVGKAFTRADEREFATRGQIARTS